MAGAAPERVYGLGRLAAAVIAAPLAALCAALAAAAIAPASDDLRLVIGTLGAVLGVAAAPCLALLARSARRAWCGSILIAAVSCALVLLS